MERHGVGPGGNFKRNWNMKKAEDERKEFGGRTKSELKIVKSIIKLAEARGI